MISENGVWSFSAVCPRGHHATQAGFTRENLRLCLATNILIQLHCDLCHQTWTATEDQRRAIRWALQNAAP